MNTLTEYAINCKWKGVYDYKLVALYGAFLPNLFFLKKMIVIQFNSTPLAVDQNNYKTKTVNVYIVYDLDNWPKVPLRNFAIKDCLFGAINVVKNSDKGNYVYSCYGIAFDGKGLCSFGNGETRNVVIFGSDSSSSSHIDNQIKLFFNIR